MAKTRGRPKAGTKILLQVKSSTRPKAKVNNDNDNDIATVPLRDDTAKNLWESLNWYIHNGVLIVEFASAKDLAAGLRDVHDAYEGTRLVGPLCGVNMPLSFVEKHYAFRYPDLSRRASTELKFEFASKSKSESETKTKNDIESTFPIFESGEHALLCNILEAANGKGDPSLPPFRYICGYIRGDPSTRLHEYAHAIYHSDDMYRTVADALWDELSVGARLYFEKELKLRNYASHNWLDEWQAYTVERATELGKKYKEESGRAHAVLRKMLGRLDWKRVDMPSFRTLKDNTPSGVD